MKQNRIMSTKACALIAVMALTKDTRNNLIERILSEYGERASLLIKIDEVSHNRHIYRARLVTILLRIN